MAAIRAPGFCDKAGDIGLRVVQPTQMLTPMLAEMVWIAVRQISAKSICHDFIRGFSGRTCRLVHHDQQVVRDVQAVLGCHDALFLSGRKKLRKRCCVAKMHRNEAF